MTSKCWLVIGGGNMGIRHVSHIHHLYPQAKIILLSSRSDIQSKASFVVNSLEAALQHQPQYAIICNAAPFHCEMAQSLISKGIHCLIEKPLSDQSIKAESLKKIAEKFPDITVLVGYHLRYKPGLEYLQKILAEKELGSIYFCRASVGHYLPDWRPQSYLNSVSAQRALGGGVLLELSHDFDYLKALFGRPQQINCVRKKVSNLEIDVEDLAVTIFQYSSGLLVTLHQDMLSFPPHRKLEITAEKGTLYWDLRNDVIEIYSNDKKIIEKKFESGFIKSEQLYLAEIQHFMECINKKASPKVNLEDACETMKMLEEAIFSSQSNQLKEITN